MVSIASELRSLHEMSIGDHSCERLDLRPLTAAESEAQAVETGAGPDSTFLTQEERDIFRICDVAEFRAHSESEPYPPVLRLIARKF